MKKVLCSIFDAAAGSFSAPVAFPSVGVAVRQFGEECSREGSQLKAHPADFSLHNVGTFDDETAQVEQSAGFTSVVARATDYIK